MLKQNFLLVIISILLIPWLVWNYHQAQLRLHSPELTMGKSIIAGRITGITHQQNYRAQLIFAVEQWNQRKLSTAKSVLLRWYGYIPPLYVGELWQFKVNLKPIHNRYQDFNAEHWAMSKGFLAQGVIEGKAQSTHLLDETIPWQYRFTHWRYQLAARITQLLEDTSYSSQSALINALLLGVRQQVSKQQWQLFRQTGTSHLMAISGLHIGLLAGYGFWLTKTLWRLSPQLIRWLPTPIAGLWGSFGFALLYSCVSGWGIPAQRSLMMLCFFLVAKLLYRPVTLWRTLILAMLTILWFEPLAVITPGFWLSFCAVACIIYVMQQRVTVKPSLWWQFGRLQWSLGLGLAGLTLFYFHNLAWSGFFANIIAVPWISFICVPLIFVASLSLLLHPTLAQWMFICAAMSLNYLMLVLQWFANMTLQSWQPNHFSESQLLLTLLAACLLLAPKGLPWRCCGGMLLLVCWPLSNVAESM